MRTIAFAGLILPGREEQWRRFAQELAGSRLEEYEALRRRLGIGGERVWFTRTPRGELAIACLETENPESAIRLLAASEEPFDAWFKGRLLELHGLDLRRLRPGSMPEEIFAYPDIPAHPGLEAS